MKGTLIISESTSKNPSYWNLDLYFQNLLTKFLENPGISSLQNVKATDNFQNESLRNSS